MIKALFFLLLTSPIVADVVSTTGQIKFDVKNDHQPEMTLNTTGLGIGTSPSSNLHVNGNALITQRMFIGGSTGSSNINIHGTLGFTFDTINTNSTLDSHSIVLADSSSDNLTITLPYAGNVNGRQYQIKKFSTLNSVWISGGGNLIDDTTSIELPESNTLASVTLISNGIQWYKTDQKDLSPTIGSDNLVGWWKLDETSGSTALDSSEQTFHGTLNSFSFSSNSTLGKINTTLDFDGLDDYVDVSDSFFETLPSNSSVSVSSWIRSDQLISNRTAIFVSSYGNHFSGRWGLHINASAQAYMYFYARNVTTTREAVSTTTVATLTWHHVLGIIDRDNLTVRIYVDGTLEATSAFLASDTLEGSDARQDTIGHNDASGANENYFDGLIDDVRIYNKALTDSEIQAIYNQGL